MSIPVLVEVYDETRRLAIAGSVVAPGDFRVKKLIPPLEKMGERAPVFMKVAQAAQAVVDSNEKTASAALLELTTLVNAILYTQGETGITGEWQPIETTDLGGFETQAGARVLKPLMEALSTTGSGRLEVKEQASVSQYSYMGYLVGSLIANLPATAVPKLEALLPSLPEKMVDQLMEPLMALKNKSA